MSHVECKGDADMVEGIFQDGDGDGSCQQAVELITVSADMR